MRKLDFPSTSVATSLAAILGFPSVGGVVRRNHLYASSRERRVELVAVVLFGQIQLAPFVKILRDLVQDLVEHTFALPFLKAAMHRLVGRVPPRKISPRAHPFASPTESRSPHLAAPATIAHPAKSCR